MRRKKTVKIWIWILVIGCAVTFFTAQGRQEEAAEKTVYVQEGDTLWSLWETHGFGRADRWIARVQRMNRMQSGTIYAGDALRVPEKE